MLSIIDLGGDAPEASSLLPVGRPEILEEHGFDRGFWACLDETSVDRSLVLVGHRRGSAQGRRWQVERVRAELPSDAPKTQDAEALTRDEHGWIYAFGSQFGSKSGPLAPSRAFVARFSEGEVAGRDGTAIPMQLRRRPFLLHRKANDALREAGVDLLPLGPNVRERYVAKTMRRGAKKEKAWHVDLRVEDWPINIEGALYVGDDTYLLGLRFPTTAKGEPILLRLRGLRGWFEASEDDEVAGDGVQVELAGWIARVSDRARPAGVRAMASHEGAVHVVLGPVGTSRKPTAIDIDYPGSMQLDCSHVVCPSPGARRARDLEGERLHTFDGHTNVEGLAHDGKGGWVYVLDEDHVLRIMLAE